MIIQPKPLLGRLERVDLRKAWVGEASDFTPWLAQAENITLLGEAIGIELEVESQEKDVGPFRADILCRDTINNHYVLIENQLERTDHTHLGQLLTYAAGLEAVTIVWVASKFTEEHRAALDWLNNATATGFNFFGLEVEVWRIGDSAMAPKFNVVSKPNDWTKTVREHAVLRSSDLSDGQQRHLAFWTQYRQHLDEIASTVIPTRPAARHYTTVPVGRASFSLVLFNNHREGRTGIYLWIGGPNAKTRYAEIERRYRDVIEARLAPLGELLWRPLPEGVESQIMLQRRSVAADPTTWPELNDWLATASAAMQDLFRPIVRALNTPTTPDTTAPTTPERDAASPELDLE